MAADEVARVPHGRFGYVTCVPDARWEGNEFVENAGHALVGMVPLRMSELSGAGQAEMAALADEAAKTIAEKGDIFQFQKQKKWKPSGVLSALFTAYAVLALNSPDDGITQFGVHACFWIHEGCPKNADG
ncbi:hypothetical protein AB0M10_33955 [Streptomyces sp. NPDC051840]|uniref:hypothetical protein n=1 Tax=Streptomyces sp. NPDC051840 TaxID=3154752 RepID=UPI003418F131